MTERLVLLGGGGHASDVLAVIESCNPGTEVLIADDDLVDRRRFEGRSVRVVDEGLDGAFTMPGSFVVAVGYPATRRRIVGRGDAAAVRWANPLVHRRAEVHPSARLEVGTVVFGCVWISPMVTIGAHTHVGYGTTIGHDTVIADCCSIMPSVAVGGDCRIDADVLVGANATVLQGLHVGDGAVIGAGAVVTKDVAAGATVVGVPAQNREQRHGYQPSSK